MLTIAADFIRGIGRIFPPVVWTALAGVTACIVVGDVCFQAGRHSERRDAEVRTMAANQVAQQRDESAKETAAAERVADAIATATLTEELRDAVQTLPDTTPSNRRLALACARLRHQGTDTADLSECR